MYPPPIAGLYTVALSAYEAGRFGLEERVRDFGTLGGAFEKLLDSRRSVLDTLGRSEDVVQTLGLLQTVLDRVVSAGPAREGDPVAA